MLELNKLYNINCDDGMKQFPDKFFDLCIVDPPYGIDEFAYRTSWKTKLAKAKNYNSVVFKQQKPDSKYFKELFRVSKNQIIWGGNYFLDHLPSTRCFIVWDKLTTANFADCELAWTSFDTSVRKFTFMWSGFMQGKSEKDGSIMQGNKAKNEKRIHPTQKPVQLYSWLLKNFAKPGYKILDTHVGSASSLIACSKLGFDYVGFEIDERYYKDAVKRMKNDISLPLFDDIDIEEAA